MVTRVVEAGVRSGEIARGSAQRTVSVMIATFMGVSAYANTLGPALGEQAVAGFTDLLDGRLLPP